MNHTILKKIFIITSSFPPSIGGMSTLPYQYCLFNQEIICEVITFKQFGSTEFDRIQKFRILRPFENLKGIDRYFFVIWGIFRIIKNWPQIILANQIYPEGIIGLFSKIIFKIPYACFAHDANDILRINKINFIKKLIINFIMNKSSIIFTNSFYSKSLLINIGISADKIKIVYPGADINKYLPQNSGERIRKIYNISNKKIILSVSRLVHNKGIQIIIKALPMVLKEIKNVHLIIVGDGNYKEQLQKFTFELGVSENVTFTGYVSDNDLPEYYAACDVFILASLPEKENICFEGFGISLIEAESSGKPVIGTKIGGIPDAIEDGNTGILCEPGNVDEIAKSIIKILGDKDLANYYGKNGRRKAEDLFNWRNFSEKINIELTEIINEGR